MYLYYALTIVYHVLPCLLMCFYHTFQCITMLVFELPCFHCALIPFAMLLLWVTFISEVHFLPPENVVNFILTSLLSWIRRARKNSEKQTVYDTAFCLQAGIYTFQLMDHYTAIVSVMFIAFFEVVAV